MKFKFELGNKATDWTPALEDTKLHTAWSNSADGTVDFTTVYPNENLLKTTTNTDTVVGENINNQTAAATNYTLINTPFNQLWYNMEVGDAFTFSVDVTISGSGFAGKFYPQTLRDPYVHMGSYYNVTKAETVRVSFTGIVTQELIDSSTVTGIQIRYDNIPTTVNLTFSRPKLEHGDTATPYTTNPSEDFANAYPAYAGTYTDYEATDSEDPSKYTWQRILGKAGNDGIAGKDGVGISDTNITYAQNTSGTNPPSTGWTAQVPTLVKGQYLWTKTVWSYTDNTTEVGYTVSYNAKDGNDGNDGIAGKDGVGISDTLVEYATSDSGTVKPTTGWSTTIPAVPEGNYLWTRTTWTYTDDTSETGYSVAKQGEKGDKGEEGESPYNVILMSSNGLLFKNGVVSTVIRAVVFKGDKDVTDLLDANQFKWKKINDDGTPDEAWNALHAGGVKSIIIGTDDVNKRATFSCDIVEI